MDDLLTEFLTETFESLDVIDNELVRFEREPNNAQILDNVFRLVHTIKGTCGFLGLPRLENLAHAAETLMGRYRDGAEVTDDGVSAILKSIDRVKDILAELETNQKEPAGQDNDLVDDLLVLAGVIDRGSSSQGADDAPAKGDDGEEGSIELFDPDDVVEQDGADAAPSSDDPDDKDSAAIQVLERALKPGEVSLDDLEAAFRDADGPELAPELPEQPAASPPAELATANTERKESSIANQTIRVNVDTIETLMTMVSELVLTRNQLLEISRRHEDSEFNTPLQRLSNVTAELQDGVMATRMQPIGSAWGKLPRIIRDLSHDLDKPIELEMVGAETELDRQVLELIRDPLTHMVRNSADHGIENKEERAKAGKPPRGVIKLSAYHEGGHIVISIADDGKGLNTARLREKALTLGLASESELAQMADAQVHKFIFHPGFSTADKVTSVSGRGVGMDVVRTNIELIGGTVDLKSAEGKGTTCTIKIPLTLAIIAALIVRSGGQRFAIPQLAVTELVRTHSNGTNRIEKLKDAEVLRLRNELLPVVRLNDLLGMTLPEDAERRESTFVVVTEVGPQSFGIVVDEVFHTEEIVVKPMSHMLKDVSMFSGNTIMGDGSVIMIVDPNGIAHAVGQDVVEADAPAEESQRVESANSAKISLLLFEAGDQNAKAVPLSLVTRLEEFEVGRVEQAGDRDMVQYRGKLMPLVYVSEEQRTALAQARNNQTEGEEARMPMLVFSEGARVMGLVVDRIVDIVEDNLTLEVQSNHPGFVGSAIVNGSATEVLDVGYYLPQAFSDWFERKEQAHVAKRRLLYAEDSAFFRNMIVPVLMSAGYEVVAVEDGSEGIELVRDGAEFDLVVTDIEMPNMDGFSFAHALREDARSSGWPVIALSAFTGPSAENKAREAGIVAFVAKFDREGLLQALKECEQTNQVEVAA